ncbi:MAG: hypothetical protein LQ337_001348 [Flavoplaca oasis]|nr:MAG: hypothetical protein LQ337_001348 [Flavoplaca oasis]
MVRCTENRPTYENNRVGNRLDETQPNALYNVCGGMRRLGSISPRCSQSDQYAGKGIQDIQSAVDQIVGNWIQCLREGWSSTPRQARDFDIGKRIQFLAVDITTKLCLGESFRCIEEDRDQHAFLDTVRTATPVSLQLSLFPAFTKALYHLIKVVPIHHFVVPSAEDKSGIGTVMGVCLAVESVPVAID